MPKDTLFLILTLILEYKHVFGYIIQKMSYLHLFIKLHVFKLLRK